MDYTETVQNKKEFLNYEKNYRVTYGGLDDFDTTHRVRWNDRRQRFGLKIN